MAWLEQNGISLFLILLISWFLFKGPIMAKVLGVMSIPVHDLAAKMSADPPPVLVDVRTPTEFNGGHAPNALLMPLGELKKRMPDFQERYAGRDVAVICRTGSRSLNGSVVFKKAGFENVYNVSGGMMLWERQGYPVKK